MKISIWNSWCGILSATLLAATGPLGFGNAYALTAAEARAMAIGDSASRIEALNKAATDPDEKTAAFIQALADDAVKTTGDRVFVRVGGGLVQGFDA